MAKFILEIEDTERDGKPFIHTSWREEGKPQGEESGVPSPTPAGVTFAEALAASYRVSREGRALLVKHGLMSQREADREDRYCDDADRLAIFEARHPDTAAELNALAAETEPDGA